MESNFIKSGRIDFSRIPDAEVNQGNRVNAGKFSVTLNFSRNNIYLNTGVFQDTKTKFFKIKNSLTLGGNMVAFMPAKNNDDLDHTVLASTGGGKTNKEGKRRSMGLSIRMSAIESFRESFLLRKEFTDGGQYKLPLEKTVIDGQTYFVLDVNGTITEVIPRKKAK